MRLLAINCLGVPMRDAHPDVQAPHRLRSDVMLRLLAGDRAYRDGWAAATAQCAAAGLDVQPCPDVYDPAQVRLLAFDCYGDAVQTFYDIDGYPVCPSGGTDDAWQAFLADHPKLAPLTLEQQRLNWIDLDLICEAHGIPRMLLMILPTRVNEPKHAGIRARYIETALECILTLAPRGWGVYQVPYDAPPDARYPEVWTHYDPAWLLRFSEAALAHHAASPRWIAPR